MRVNFSFLVIIYLATTILTRTVKNKPKILSFSDFIAKDNRLADTKIDHKLFETVLDRYDRSQGVLLQTNLDSATRELYLKIAQDFKKKLDELLSPTKWRSANGFLKYREEVLAGGTGTLPKDDRPVLSEAELIALQTKKDALIKKAEATFLAGAGEEAERLAEKYDTSAHVHRTASYKAYDTRDNHKRIREAALASADFKMAHTFKMQAQKERDAAREAYNRYLAENLPLLK